MKKKFLYIYLALFFVLAIYFYPFIFQRDLFVENEVGCNTAICGECTALAVGKLASVDGSILLGHNEDDSPPCTTIVHITPRMYHEPGEKIVMWDTGTIIDQVEVTWALLWSESPRYRYFDGYLNEWGVAVSSNSGGSSRETPPYDLTQGGIGHELKKLAAERAKTAREAVKIMGKLIEEYGYAASARTYLIADPNEAWFLCAVAGRHWVAQRIPDDEVAVVPNYFTIRQINLEDEENFQGSSDLIEYAIQKGWYNPASGPFDFAKVYNAPATQTSLSNRLRHWGALRLLTGIEYPNMYDLPFSVKPNRQLGVKDVTEVLRHHYEGTSWGWNPTLSQHPHSYRIDGTSITPICRPTTQESDVWQLRNNMPPSIGCIYWRAQGRPCESVYIPWYLGILEVPEPYTIGTPGIYDDPKSAWATFHKMCQLVDADYVNRIGIVRAEWNHMESKIYERQDNIERTALKLYNIGGERHEYLARKFLTQYTEGLALKAFRKAHEFIELWEPGWAGEID